MPVDPRVLDTPFGHVLISVGQLLITLGHVAAVLTLCLTLVLTARGQHLLAGRGRDRVTWYRRRMTEVALILSGAAILLDIILAWSVGIADAGRVISLPLSLVIIVLTGVTVAVLLRQFGPSLGIPDWTSQPR